MAVLRYRCKIVLDEKGRRVPDLLLDDSWRKETQFMQVTVIDAGDDEMIVELTAPDEKQSEISKVAGALLADKSVPADGKLPVKVKAEPTSGDAIL